MSPQEKLQSQLASLKQRLEKAKAKLATAETEGSEHIDALRSGAQKLEDKLTATQAELDALTAEGS